MIGEGATERHAGRRYRIRDEIARSWLRRPGPLPDGTGFVSGAALLVDRRSFESIGGFDEGFFMFFEDIDLCLRANAAGISTHIDPRWRVLHAGGHSTNSRFSSALEWSYESACRFHAQRGSSINRYRAYVIADSIARAAVRSLSGSWPLGRAHLRLARRASTDLVTRRTAPRDE
jgi:GT2 family glycosyltransferase